MTDRTRLLYGWPLALVRLDDDVPGCGLAAGDELVIDFEREAVAGDLIITDKNGSVRRLGVRKFPGSVVVQLHRLTGESADDSPVYVREKLHPWPLKPVAPLAGNYMPCPDCLDGEGRYRHDPQEHVCPTCENHGSVPAMDAFDAIMSAILRRTAEWAEAHLDCDDQNERDAGMYGIIDELVPTDDLSLLRLASDEQVWRPTRDIGGQEKPREVIYGVVHYMASEAVYASEAWQALPPAVLRREAGAD